MRRTANHALRQDIDDKVQFWNDCIQSRVPGATILIVGVIPVYAKDYLNFETVQNTIVRITTGSKSIADLEISFSFLCFLIIGCNWRLDACVVMFKQIPKRWTKSGDNLMKV